MLPAAVFRCVPASVDSAVLVHLARRRGQPGSRSRDAIPVARIVLGHATRWRSRRSRSRLRRWRRRWRSSTPRTAGWCCGARGAAAAARARSRAAGCACGRAAGPDALASGHRPAPGLQRAPRGRAADRRRGRARLPARPARDPGARRFHRRDHRARRARRSARQRARGVDMRRAPARRRGTATRPGRWPPGCAAPAAS